VQKPFKNPLFLIVFFVSLQSACSKSSSTHNNGDPPTSNNTPNAENEEPPPTLCDASLVFSNHATLEDLNKERLEGTLSDENIQTHTSCSGDASHVHVFSYVPKADGLLRMTLGSLEPLFIAVKESCEESAQELLCEPSSTHASMHVTQGIPLALMVAAPSPLQNPVQYTLTATLVPYVGLNSPCDPQKVQNTCTQNLRCDHTLLTPVCVPNQAPSLASATVYQTGRFADDLYVQVTGTDSDLDVMSVVLNDTPYAFTQMMYQSTSFTARFIAYGFFALQSSSEDAVFNVAVVDSGNLVSNSTQVSLEQAPVLAEGLLCDPDELQNICHTGYYCAQNRRMCTAGQAPVLVQIGFFERDNNAEKRIAIQATDANNDIALLTLEFLNSSSQPVVVNIQGTQRSSMVFNTPQETHKPDFYKLIRSQTLSTEVTHIAVTLKDRTGLTSQRWVTDLKTMPVSAQGNPCDAQRRFNTCAQGLMCEPNTRTCSAGENPHILQAAYLRKPSGVVVLIEAQDPNSDLATATLEFLTEDEQPVWLFDTDNNHVSDTHITVQNASGFENLNHVALLTYEVTELSAYAPKIGVTLQDATGRISARQVLSLANTVVKRASEACDTKGFNVCEAGTKCSSEGLCVGLEPLRASTCTSAQTWLGQNIVLQTAQPSLWDPPSACAPSRPRGASEGVMRFSLQQEASAVRISTNHAGTTLDTVVYVLLACGHSGVEALGCNDDVNPHLGNYTSVLELHDVPAGDYLVVVDSYTALSAQFEVSVEVE
jgi:hypothetical protein